MAMETKLNRRPSAAADQMSALLAEAGQEEPIDATGRAQAAAAEEVSPDGEASSPGGKRVQRARRPTLAALEASAGEISDTDAVQHGPAEHEADDEDLQDYEPEGMTAAPTSPPPSAKRKRSRACPPPAVKDEAGQAEPALSSGPRTDAALAQSEHPEDGPDAEAAAEPSREQPSPAEGPPPSATGQRTRARQPLAKFQPTFSPDRPAPKRASKAAVASVVKAEQPAAAGAPGGFSRARRVRGSAANPADELAPGDVGVKDGGVAADSASVSAMDKAAASDAPLVAAVAKQGGRRKQGGNAAAASARQAHPLHVPDRTRPATVALVRVKLV